MTTWDKVEWDDVADRASSLFWMSTGSGLDWAELMWRYLSKARLTRHQTELERCQVMIYVLALADIYSEFCHIAYEDSRDTEYCDWATALELSSFRIGQLLGSEADFEPNEIDDHVLMESGLGFLISGARDRTLAALSKYFGSTLRLFQSLCCCSLSRYEDELSIDAVSLDLSFENMGIYSWLEGEVSVAKRSTPVIQKSVNSKAVSLDRGVQLSLSI